jgi:hypothetical protein
MEKKWINRNIDLSLLTTHLGEFLKTKEFNGVKGRTETGYQILAGDSKHYKLEGHISVTIEGKPEDFSIKLELCKEGKKNEGLPRSIMLSTMFGGGYFLRKQLKSDEEWLKFKRDFWIHVDKAISNLTNTIQKTDKKLT